MNICKHATSTAQFPFLYSPVGKNSWFNVLKHILKQVTSTLQTMKQWNLIFLLFSQNGNLSIHFQPYSRWEEGRSAKRFPASFPQYFWLLILIFFPPSCKISGPYLVPVWNYWTWTKTIPQKKIGFSGQICVKYQLW